MEYDCRQVIRALGEVSLRDKIDLAVVGQMLDGTPLEGSDCVRIFESQLPLTRKPGDIDGLLLPLTTTLIGNYPNPFNPVTEISYGIHKTADVRLEIFNIAGQRVTSLVEGVKEAGFYTATWNAESLASGIYLYRLTAGGFVETKKMVLLK
jgi:hypothetical protein